jgi:MFS-type transporter involved in bile tolerance (Atg22 family)
MVGSNDRKVLAMFRTGLILAGLLALSDLFSFALGPQPLGVVIASTVLGVLTLIALVPAWRTGRRAAVTAVAVTRIVSALLAVPAFFVSDVAGGVKVVAGVIIVLAVVSTVLLFTGRTSVPARVAAG